MKNRFQERGCTFLMKPFWRASMIPLSIQLTSWRALEGSLLRLIVLVVRPARVVNMMVGGGSAVSSWLGQRKIVVWGGTFQGLELCVLEAL